MSDSDIGCDSTVNMSAFTVEEIAAAADSRAKDTGGVHADLYEFGSTHHIYP